MTTPPGRPASRPKLPANSKSPLLKPGKEFTQERRRFRTFPYTSLRETKPVRIGLSTALYHVAAVVRPVLLNVFTFICTFSFVSCWKRSLFLSVRTESIIYSDEDDDNDEDDDHDDDNDNSATV